MANNPYANEVKYNGQTIMSLRGDTVTPSDLKRGVTAHDETGAPIVGTYDGVDLDNLGTSTNEISDSDLFVTKEDGETSWAKKSLLKIWDYISKKLGIFIGTTAEWNALSQSEQDTYNLVFKTDDNINMQSAHDFNVGTTKTGTVQTSISTSIASTDLVDDAIGTLLNNDATLKDHKEDKLFLTCSTARNVAAKVVDCTGFNLVTGAKIAVRFTNTGSSNPSSGNLTLNVNATGAKTIVDGHTNKTVLTYTSAALFYNNMVAEFIYDGTYWVYMNRDNNTTYSAMSTSELTTGTATTSRVVRADYLHAGIEQIAESAKIDTANNTATFTSSDTTDASATSWTSVTKLASGESHKSIFAKMSQMFKNIRYLYKMLGTTDISSIGDGTVTGGLDTLKDALTVRKIDITDISTTNGVAAIYARKYGHIVVAEIDITLASSWANGTRITFDKPSDLPSVFNSLDTVSGCSLNMVTAQFNGATILLQNNYGSALGAGTTHVMNIVYVCA